MKKVFSTVADISPREFRRVTEVTYLGCVYGTMAALKSMRRRGRGRIVHIGSALAYRGIPLQSAYCGAKHALRGFTASLRIELLHEGSAIRVSIVELPAVNTPQFDWARVHLKRPLTALHRTRGSFSAEAKSRVHLFPGEIARVGALVAGALLVFGLGAGLGWWRRARW
jgi:NAD(P)-dependent dehydrogenase (short-subunit alcohol dehydrogenase family)